jgi:hypothetical protein
MDLPLCIGIVFHRWCIPWRIYSGQEALIQAALVCGNGQSGTRRRFAPSLA